QEISRVLSRSEAGAPPRATARPEPPKPARTQQPVEPFQSPCQKSVPIGHLIHFRPANIHAAFTMDRTQLLSLLPHQGPALWLDRVLEHDAGVIRGLRAWSHLQPFGPDASPCLLFVAAAQLSRAHGALYGAGKSIEMARVGKLSALQLHHESAERNGPLRVS